MSKIADIRAYEVLDSRGNPTVNADVILESGEVGSACAPSGASTGSREALELRDGDIRCSLDPGVFSAIGFVSPCCFVRPLAKALISLLELCRMTIEAGGPEDKARTGAKPIQAVSRAPHKAIEMAKKLPVYPQLG